MLRFLNVLFKYCTGEYCIIIIINNDPNLASSATILVTLVAVSGFHYPVP